MVSSPTVPWAATSLGLTGVHWLQPSSPSWSGLASPASSISAAYKGREVPASVGAELGIAFPPLCRAAHPALPIPQQGQEPKHSFQRHFKADLQSPFAHIPSQPSLLPSLEPPVFQAWFLSGFMQEDAPYWGRGRGDTEVHLTRGVHGEQGTDSKTTEKQLKSDSPFPKSWKKKEVQEHQRTPTSLPVPREQGRPCSVVGSRSPGTWGARLGAAT